MASRRRAGWAAIAVAVLVVGVPTGFAGDSEAKRKRCKASEVKRTVSYRKGGRKHRAKGCAPRTGKVPATVGAALPAALKKTRAVAARLAPRAAKRARKRKAARRVARADRATDAALGRSAAPLATAATVGTDSHSGPVPGPPGTRSTQSVRVTEWSGDEPRVGREGMLVVDTRGTRIAGASSSRHKSVSFKYLMDRCPDGGGIGRGPVTYTQIDRWTVDGPGGPVVMTERGVFEGEIVAHFADNAHIASVDVTGDWSWSTETRRAGTRVGRHAVGGGAHSEGFRQSADGSGNHVDVRTTVATATDDRTAISGAYLGLFTVVLPDIFMEEALDGIQKRALSGACVRVVANEPTVHVSPASTVPIVAHLVDSARATFSGTITTTHERVRPASADGNPDARFTYQSALSGTTDRVQLNHVSRRGVGGTSVEVIYDSFTYRVLSATLDETIDGERDPQPGFGNCPLSGHQTNKMNLGPQPLDPNSGDGHLIDDGANRSGLIRASGTASLASLMHGCDVGQEPPEPCTAPGSFETDRDVSFQVTLPKAGGPAQVQWDFNHEPAAGIGNEGIGTTCLLPNFHAHQGDDSLGAVSVPRAVFEASTPQTLVLDLSFDLPADQSGELHATLRYSLRIQRVSAG